MNNIATAWNSLCLPAQVYLLLALLSIAASLAAPLQGWSMISVFLGNILWAAVWTFIVHLLCQAGHTNWAWAFAIGLPVLIFALIILSALGFLIAKR